MLFVPLPLITALLLGFLFIRFVLTRDMTSRAHQLFACLIALYAVQALLSSLRWGYGVEEIAPMMAYLAPILPALAYLAYTALAGRQTGWQLWPVAVVAAVWLAISVTPFIADPLILISYLGFGALLVRLFLGGAEQLTLSPLNDAREILVAICLTGVTLIASGLMDVYVIYDFVTNDGRNTGLLLTYGQSAFTFVIGAAAAFGRSTPAPESTKPRPDRVKRDMTEGDENVLERLENLFVRDRLHISEDLSLRRLSRRLGVSDREVSNAVNRVRQMSVSQYVNTFRIKEACALLSETNDTILTVSLASGFATKSNFNREFLRVTGKTPTQWRKENKKSIQ